MMRMLLTRVCFYLNCAMTNVSQEIRLTKNFWLVPFVFEKLCFLCPICDFMEF